jgi:hypothetical protein
MHLSASTILSSALFVSFSDACQVLEMYSDLIGQRTFKALPFADLPSGGTGRVSYASEGDTTYYLYHIISDPVEEGVGRWYDTFKIDHTIVFISCK